MSERWIILRDVAGVTAGYKWCFLQVIVPGNSCDLLILAFSVALCTVDTALKELSKRWCGCNLAPHMVVLGSYNILKIVCFLNMTDWSVKCFGMVMNLVNMCWCIYCYSGVVHFLKCTLLYSMQNLHSYLVLCAVFTTFYQMKTAKFHWLLL